MKLNYLFIAGLLSSIECIKFKNIIGLGDGFSDIGNYFKLSGGKDPDPKFYYEGRLSDGPVWIEYLTEALGNPKFKSFAYHGASCDGANYDIQAPSAREQVNKLFKEYYNQNHLTLDIEKDESLLCYTFTGSEYFLDDKDGGFVVDKLAKHLKSFLEIYPIKYVLIPTTVNFDKLPITSTYERDVNEFKQQFEEGWNEKLEILRSEHPDTVFINYDYALFWKKIANMPSRDGPGNKFITNEPCLHYEDTKVVGKCDDPSKYGLYDHFYPTTAVHKLIARDVLKYLKDGKNPYEKRY